MEWIDYYTGRRQTVPGQEPPSPLIEERQLLEQMPVKGRTMLRATLNNLDQMFTTLFHTSAHTRTGR